jgi:transposase
MLALAHASRAEMAARVAWLLGYRASRDSLMPRQCAERFAFPAPQVLGVDEFALRRGHTYGTRLVDLPRHQPLAVLEGRTAEPLATWLQAHPTGAILVHDRAEAYALAGRQATPDALQVPDRVHLVQNVSDALTTLLHARRWYPSTPATRPQGAPRVSSATTARAAELLGQARQPTACKRAAWETVQESRDRGLSLRQMAQAVGLDRRTVRRYLEADEPPVYPVRRPRPTQLTPDMKHLAERWAQGCHNARQRYDELVPRGYRGSASMVRVVVRPWRTRQDASPSTLTHSHLARLMLPPAGHLTEAERAAIEDLRRGNPLLAQGYELKTRFHTILAEHDLPALERWLQAAATSELPSFPAVARCFRQDSTPSKPP